MPFQKIDDTCYIFRDGHHHNHMLRHSSLTLPKHLLLRPSIYSRRQLLPFPPPQEDEQEEEKDLHDSTPPPLPFLAPIEPQSRRRSSLVMMFIKAKPHVASSYSKDMRRLAIAVAYKRHLLVNELLQHEHAMVIVKLRFVSAVDQVLQAKSPVDREKLGRQVCSTFIYGRQMFRITDLSPELLVKLKRDRFEWLGDAKREVLEQLVLDARVMRAVTYVEMVDY